MEANRPRPGGMRLMAARSASDRPRGGPLIHARAARPDLRGLGLAGQHLTHTRLVELEHWFFAAAAADVTTVVVGGRDVVTAGSHVALPDVGPDLELSIAEALGVPPTSRRTPS